MSDDEHFSTAEEDEEFSRDLGRDLLGIDELRALREKNPEGLYRHLDLLRQRFLFGVTPQEGWGGAFQLRLNRNVAVHLVPCFSEDMPDAQSLPQYSLMPDENRADQIEGVDFGEVDGDPLRGLLFWVDPFEFDVLMREAAQIAEEYPDWDMLPDSYYLGTELVRWVMRVFLEQPQVAGEREFDFRLGLPGLGPAPLTEEPMLSAEDLITYRGEDVDEDADRDEDDEDDDDLRGMRTIPVTL